MLLNFVLLLTAFTISLAGSPRLIGKTRPCRLDDYKCIGKHLALNSKCKLRLKPVLKQYRLAHHRFETPNFNASYIDHNLIVTGQHRCFVSEFYFNMKSDSGILGIDCPLLNFKSNRTLIQHWPLQEDTIHNYCYDGTYPLIRLTMSLLNADILNICNEFTFAYIAGQPIYNIVPNDRQTQNVLSKDLSKLNTFERETFFYRANFLARTFINSRLCDFGCV